jgi:hypothetical protein
MTARARVPVVHIVGGVLLAVILVAGVGGTVRLIASSSSQPDSSAAIAASSSASTEATGSGTGAATTATSAPTVTASASSNSGGGGGGPRSVRVGGATLQNLYPQTSKKLGPGPVYCLKLENRGYVVPVRIDAIAIETDEGPSQMALGNSGGCELPPCLGVEMRPSDNVCHVEVEVPDVAGRYAGRVILQLSRLCSDAAELPCSLVPPPPPSPGDPVTAIWSTEEEWAHEVEPESGSSGSGSSGSGSSGSGSSGSGSSGSGSSGSGG